MVCEFLFHRVLIHLKGNDVSCLVFNEQTLCRSGWTVARVPLMVAKNKDSSIIVWSRIEIYPSSVSVRSIEASPDIVSVSILAVSCKFRQNFTDR